MKLNKKLLQRSRELLGESKNKMEGLIAELESKAQSAEELKQKNYENDVKCHSAPESPFCLLYCLFYGAPPTLAGRRLQSWKKTLKKNIYKFQGKYQANIKKTLERKNIFGKSLEKTFMEKVRKPRRKNIYGKSFKENTKQK